jgi:hypothetical protein
MLDKETWICVLKRRVLDKENILNFLADRKADLASIADEHDEMEDYDEVSRSWYMGAIEEAQYIMDSIESGYFDVKEYKDAG